MFEDGIFAVIGENGEEMQCEVLVTFDCEETGKSYVIYTDNTEDDQGNTKIYASTYDPSGDDLQLFPIATERKWELIESVMDELMADPDGEEE